MTTDQEGGLVQHLQGPGFDTMPTAVDQGAMSTDALRQSAAVWGSQLKPGRHQRGSGPRWWAP